MRGTQFRIWATNVLRDHIVRGYTLNEKRLQAQTERLAELQKTVGLMGRILDQLSLATDEATGLLQVIRDPQLLPRLLAGMKGSGGTSKRDITLKTKDGSDQDNTGNPGS